MKTVHCNANCIHRDVNTEACSKFDILIENGGYCLSFAKTGALNIIQAYAIHDIRKERDRQDTLWGEQNNRPQFWTGILGEEYGELCEAINETVFDNGGGRIKGGYTNMRKEAIHVAAVALAFIECLDRNKAEWGIETKVNGGTDNE